MTIEQTKIACPQCEQDWMIRAKIIQRGELIRICPECDSMVVGDKLPTETNCTDFGTYMEAQGLSGLWTELSIIDLWRFPEQEEGQPFRVVK